MKNLLYIILLLFISPLTAMADNPFKGTFQCREAGLNITLDPEEESIEVPGYSFFGKTHGYMSGTGVYGTWLIISCEVKDSVAKIRFSNDTGSDSQTIKLTRSDSLTYEYKAVGGNNVRKAAGRKLVKIGDTFVFKKIK